MNGNESAIKKEWAVSLTAPPLKIIEDMLHNRITQKKKEVRKNNPEHSGHRKIMDRDTDIAVGLRTVLVSEDG